MEPRGVPRTPVSCEPAELRNTELMLTPVQRLAASEVCCVCAGTASFHLLLLEGRSGIDSQVSSWQFLE